MHFLFVEDISNGLFLQDEKYQLLQWFLNQYPCTFAPSFLFLVHSWTCKTWYIVYLHDLKKSGLVLKLFSRSCLDRQLYFVNCSIFGWWGFWREQTSAKWTSQTLTFASLTPTLSLSSSLSPHERLHKCIRTSQNILQRLPCPQKLSWKKKISDTQRGRGDTVGASCTHAHTWSIQTRTLTNNLWPSGCTAGAVTLCSFLPPSSISQLSVWGLIERMEAGVGEELRGRKRTGD